MGRDEEEDEGGIRGRFRAVSFSNKSGVEFSLVQVEEEDLGLDCGGLGFRFLGDEVEFRFCGGWG